VLRGERHAGVLFGGSILELGGGAVARRLGPDVLANPPDLASMVARLRTSGECREIGDALLDQRLVAGIGNMWKAEALWAARVSPWARVRDVSDEELTRVLDAAHRLMRAGVDEIRGRRRVYRRAAQPCPRCGTAIRSLAQGDGARMAYWCPVCQPGPEPR
jgi:endonuclease-8